MLYTLLFFSHPIYSTMYSSFERSSGKIRYPATVYTGSHMSKPNHMPYSKEGVMLCNSTGPAVCCCWDRPPPPSPPARHVGEIDRFGVFPLWDSTVVLFARSSKVPVSSWSWGRNDRQVEPLVEQLSRGSKFTPRSSLSIVVFFDRRLNLPNRFYPPLILTWGRAPV